jgi:pyrroloquinoline quinone (PQQ) biosynthesis protein C
MKPMSNGETKVYNEIIRSVRDYYSRPPRHLELLQDWREWPVEQVRRVMQLIVKQQRPWVLGFPRWLGNIYGNCKVVEVRRVLLGDMEDEDATDPRWQDGHVGLHRRLALALGLSDRDLEEGPFLPEVAANYYSMEGISKNYPWLEALAAVSGTECLTLGHIPRMYDDMEEFIAEKSAVSGSFLPIYKALGLSTGDLAFYWAHDESRLEVWEGRESKPKPKGAEAQHQALLIRTLTDHARDEETRRRVVKMVRLGHSIYHLRWEGIARAVEASLRHEGRSPWGAAPSAPAS